MHVRVRPLVVNLAAHSTGDVAVRVAGGSSTNPSRTLARTSSSRTWQAGGNTMPEFPDAAYCTVTPDWVCEVLSPSIRRIDLYENRPVCAREGIRHLWFVDPVARDLESFELLDGEWVLTANTTAKEDDPISIPSFHSITFNLGNLWA